MRKWLPLITVCLGTFMLLVDVTIVNVALPDIEQAFHASLSDLQWVIDAYALTLAALLLTAGSLADRFGNRPFMVAGLVMQAVGLGWVALIADTSVGYLELGTALTIAGVGTSLCFPTVANAVMSSVPMEEAGVASGANSSLREVGGVFGVAVLAAVFTRHSVYASPAAFVDGFRPALFVGAALAAAGIIAALLAPGRPASEVSGLAVVAEPVD